MPNWRQRAMATLPPSIRERARIPCQYLCGQQILAPLRPPRHRMSHAMFSATQSSPQSSPPTAGLRYPTTGVTQPQLSASHNSPREFHFRSIHNGTALMTSTHKKAFYSPNSLRKYSITSRISFFDTTTSSSVAYVMRFCTKCSSRYLLIIHNAP